MPKEEENLLEEVESLGKGVLPDPPDARDYTAETQFGAFPIDWSKEFRLPEPKSSHQGTSDACVAYSSSYLHEILKDGKEFSRRDLFSRIYLKYGAYLRDGVRAIVEKGQADKDEVKDPRTPTPQNMRDKTGTKQEYRDDDIEANYFVVKHNTPDAVAQAVRDFKGAIFGVFGTNAGWRDKTNPTPPNSHTGAWGHAIYAFGYHLHNGQKCIIAKSSWCTRSHSEHHIKENYFNKGMTYNAWCVIPKENQFMTNSRLVRLQVETSDGSKTWEYSIADPVTSEDGLISLMRNRGIKPPLDKDGKLVWEDVEKLVSGTIVLK